MERARTASMPVGRSLQNSNRSASPPNIVTIHPAKYKRWQSHGSGRRRTESIHGRTESRYIEEESSFSDSEDSEDEYGRSLPLPLGYLF